MYRYSQGGEIIEIIVRDSTGAKIDFYKFNKQDKLAEKKVMNILKYKYGVFSEGKKDEDIDWLKGVDW